ncbi:M48 family metallopeptidase [Ghiorsea bivora]|uniref:M48 family metallopeptidase n=1 Tax=Ghiorsea bivora TaxID=1485545 RepID=UPI000570E5D5|nr:SprT family zinc-dependent metalloprotease [Ghiorsea bivora]
MPDTPFAWKLRLSKRAKRPRITINVYGDVVLVWPHTMSQRGISNMLQTHTAWVLKHLQAIGDKSKHSVVLPKQIYLPALTQTWLVKYEEGKGRLRTSKEQHTLTLIGNLEDKAALQGALRRWLKQQAKLYLNVCLAQTAAVMGLDYQSVSIRLQKKRWGSCSAKGNISLNAALLFLPDFLVQHVLTHELAHLKHLNHSKAFWAEVEKFEPEYKENRRLLKQYTKHVPAWLTEQL